MTDIRQEHETWLAAQKAKKDQNPCIRVYGPGPEDTFCRTCARVSVRRYSKNYFKCALREETRGAGSDHRLSWPACGQYLKLEARP